MKFYKKAAAVLAAVIIGITPAFVEAPLAQDSELSLYGAVPTVDKDGYYQIYNADQLYWLSDRFNNEYELDLKARIMQDIEANEGVVDGSDKTKKVWVPLGVDRGTGSDTDNLNFTGEIDGQGHKISGLYCVGGRLAGLVGHNHGTIKNLGIENSFFNATMGSSSTAYAGSFAAFHNEGIIQNCYSTANVRSNYVTGGISGGIKGSAKIVNCFTTGKTASTKERAYAAAITYLFDGTSKIENCYYMQGSDDRATAKTAAQFASGEVAYLLNNGGGNFYQNIDNGKEADAYPVLDSTHGKVYLKGGSYTNGTEVTTVEATTEVTTQATTEATTEATTQSTSDKFVYGSASGEGVLTATDAVMILQKSLDESVILPIEKKTPDYFKYIDVDADGTLTATDASMVLQKVLIESTVFPAEKKK